MNSSVQDFSVLNFSVQDLSVLNFSVQDPSVLNFSVQDFTVQWKNELFSPRLFSPELYSPRHFSPELYSPRPFSPGLFSPRLFSSEHFSPRPFSPFQSTVPRPKWALQSKTKMTTFWELFYFFDRIWLTRFSLPCSFQHCTALPPPHLISKMAQVVISIISEQHQVGKIYELLTSNWYNNNKTFKNCYKFVAPLVKKCQNIIFTTVQYTPYTPNFIGLWKNT